MVTKDALCQVTHIFPGEVGKKLFIRTYGSVIIQCGSWQFYLVRSCKQIVLSITIPGNVSVTR